MRQAHITLSLVVLLACAALFGLTGCSPQYDWRMVSLGNGELRAMFPDKPRTTERQFEFEGHAITFSLTSTSVNDVLFTVGYASLPNALQADQVARERLVRRVQASLYQNLSVALPTSMPAAASQFAVEGKGQGKLLRLEAIVWATPKALIEGVVIGAVDGLPQEQVNEFLRELAPDQRPHPESGA